MSRRTLLLLLLIVLTGAAVWMRAVKGRYDESTGVRGTPNPTAKKRNPDVPSLGAAQVQHARVDDQARILAPFGTRLGRMADLFYDDLGIDIHVVTTGDAQS